MKYWIKNCCLCKQSLLEKYSPLYVVFLISILDVFIVSVFGPHLESTRLVLALSVLDFGFLIFIAGLEIPLLTIKTYSSSSLSSYRTIGKNKIKFWLGLSLIQFLVFVSTMIFWIST